MPTILLHGERNAIVIGSVVVRQFSDVRYSVVEGSRGKAAEPSRIERILGLVEEQSIISAIANIVHGYSRLGTYAALNFHVPFGVLRIGQISYAV